MEAARPSPRSATWLRSVGVAAFAVQFVVMGLALHGLRPYLSEPRAVFSAVQSALLWGLVALPAARSRAWRAGSAIVAAAIVVLQLVFHARYGTFIDAEVVRSTVRFWADIKPELTAFVPMLAGLTAIAAAVEYAWLSWSCGSARTSP